MASMHLSDRRSSRRPSASSADRRQKSRLRDLCDEVLASFRVASDRDPISSEDRAVAAQVLSGMTPVNYHTR
jgi:hypothetical protein